MTGQVMRLFIAVSIVLAFVLPAKAQLANCINLDRVNGRLAGRVVDYTNNHGSDRRIFSPILGMVRDLYVYLPPGYDPGRTYSLVLFFHMADVDEHFFIGSKVLKELDDLIVCGGFPPAIVACPDGTYRGWNRSHAKHSLYVNGLGGRFKDHILQEVVPFLTASPWVISDEQGWRMWYVSSPGWRVVDGAPVPAGWFGKQWACAQGAQLAIAETRRVSARGKRLPCRVMTASRLLWECGAARAAASSVRRSR